MSAQEDPEFTSSPTLYSYIHTAVPLEELRADCTASAQQMIEGPDCRGEERRRHGNYENPTLDTVTCTREGYH